MTIEAVYAARANPTYFKPLDENRCTYCGQEIPGGAGVYSVDHNNRAERAFRVFCHCRRWSLFVLSAKGQKWFALRSNDKKALKFWGLTWEGKR